MQRIFFLGVIAVASVAAASCSRTPTSGERLRAMRTGVWLSSGGTYTVWTDSHYFVVSASGDSTSTNIYCGASQVRYTDRGIARKQNVRLRQRGTSKSEIYVDHEAYQESPMSRQVEIPLQIDEELFDPKQCVIEGGVIYDAISEETDDHILLSTCNGDKVKIFNDGRSVYLPATGGEFWSFRIEPY